MKSIAETISLFKPDPKAPKHELSASVNEIIKVVGEEKGYGYGYWLKLVKKSGLSFGGIMGLLKSIENMDKKYPKGAVLTNKLLNKNGKKSI